MPVRTLRLGWHAMGLPLAFAVHLIGLFVAGLGLAIIEQTYSNSMLFYGFNAYDLYSIRRALLELAAMFLFTELMYLISAFAFMGWAARSEPWGRSYVRSLTRWFQLTPWHVAVSLAMVLVFLGFEELRYDYYYESYSSSGYYTGGMGRNAEAFTYLLQGVLALAAYGIVAWRTLVALGVHRPEPGWAESCIWPAHCEGCGYSLAGLAADRDCPECGRAVFESKHTLRSSNPSSPLAAMGAAVTTPRQLGESLPVHRAVQGHGWAYAYTLGSLALVGFIGVWISVLAMLIWAETDAPEMEFETLIYLLFGGMISSFYVMGFGILIIQSAATLVGLGHGLFGGRSRMHTANQAACFASGVLIPWAMFVWLAGTVWFIAMIESLGSAFGGGPSHPVADVLLAAVPLLLLAVGLGMFVYYLFLTARIVSATKHANT